MKLTDLTASMARGKNKKREISVIELTKAYLERIDELNGTIGAYITVCAEQGPRQAESVQKTDSGEDILPLAGIPPGLRIYLYEGRKTTCAKMLDNFLPRMTRPLRKSYPKAM